MRSTSQQSARPREGGDPRRRVLDSHEQGLDSRLRGNERMWRCLALSLLMSFACILPAQAQSPADFYRGKSINLAISFPPGGGYDLYARILGRHMGKHIPGNPTIVPQNMPGAG